MSGLLKLLRSKWNPPAKTTSTFNGKTVVVTGSNTGLGLEAARSFLELSASRVILAVRNTAKGNIARDQIETQTGRMGDVSVFELDMNRIDLVILNAGLHNREYVTSPEGWEETLQVNTLSTTLLALLLLPKLRSARQEDPASLPHLVLVCSALHAGVARYSLPSPPQNILSALSTPPEPAIAFNGGRQYAISKLLLLYAVKSLASLAMSPSGEPQVIVTSSSMSLSWEGNTIASLKVEPSGLSTACLPVPPKMEVEHSLALTPGDLVISAEGKEIQEQVWKEIVDVLKAKVPEVGRLPGGAK